MAAPLANPQEMPLANVATSLSFGPRGTDGRMKTEARKKARTLFSTNGYRIPIYTYLCYLCLFIAICIYLIISIYIYLYLFVPIYIYLYLFISIYIYVDIHIYIYTYTHIHTHTYTHTHTYIHTHIHT